MKTVYEKNYDLMVRLGIIPADGKIPAYRKSVASGVMNLVVERNILLDGFNGQACIGFSMAHYFVQNGDLCSDPVIEVLFYPELNMVEAITFEMSIPPVYKRVYPSEGQVNIREKASQNSFLSSWLKNLVAQGHGVNWINKSEAA